METKFDMGLIVMTAGIQALIARSAMEHEDPGFAEEIAGLLRRHAAGDWGDVYDEDGQMNDEALAAGDCNVMSSYITSEGKVWIKTDAYSPTEHVTTVLLPEEY